MAFITLSGILKCIYTAGLINITITIGTLNGPSVPATAKDCDEPDSATRAVRGRWHWVVDSSSFCSLTSVNAARKTLVGEAQESIIL